MKVFSIHSFITALLAKSEAQTSSIMQINQNAPVKQSNQILIQSNPEKVWAVLADINQWPTWNEHIAKVKVETNVSVGAKFRWKVNGATINSTLHTVKPNSAIGWSGTTFGGSAIHNWHLERTAEGTLVRVEESMEGWLIGLLKNKMNRDLEKDMQYWLEVLKKESER